MNLYNMCRKLRDVFIKYQQELWYSFTISLDSSGKFKLHYDYTDWFATDYSFDAQLVIWEYKYLGAVPDDEEDKEIINQYQREFPDDPI